MNAMGIFDWLALALAWAALICVVIAIASGNRLIEPAADDETADGLTAADIARLMEDDRQN